MLKAGSGGVKNSFFIASSISATKRELGDPFVDVPSFQLRQSLLLTPGSKIQDVYSRMPVESTGPANAFFSAATWTALKQPSRVPASQRSTAGSKPQA